MEPAIQLVTFWYLGQYGWFSGIMPSERSSTNNSHCMIPLRWNPRTSKLVYVGKRIKAVTYYPKSRVFLWNPLWAKMESFPKVHIKPLCFYKRSTLVPVFGNWKKRMVDFTFMKTGEKPKKHSAFVWQWAITEATHTVNSFFPGNYT